MAYRTEMSSVGAHTERLIGQGSGQTVSFSFSQDEIQSALDETRIALEWVLLDHDPDFRHFYSRSHFSQAIATRTFITHPISVPDFSSYTTVGFYDQNRVLRQDRSEDSAAYTPNVSTLENGSFVFSTPPQRELFIFGNAYNVWRAAADLMMQTPDFGRVALKSSNKFGVSETYGVMDKVKEYQKRGLRLNRKNPVIHRA